MAQHKEQSSILESLKIEPISPKKFPLICPITKRLEKEPYNSLDNKKFHFWKSQFKNILQDQLQLVTITITNYFRIFVDSPSSDSFTEDILGYQSRNLDKIL